MNKFALKILFVISQYCAQDAELKKAIQTLHNEMSVWLLKDETK